MAFMWSNPLPLGPTSFRSRHLNTATVATNPLVHGTSNGAYYGFPKKCAPQPQVLNTWKLGGRGNFKQHVPAEWGTLGMCFECHTWSLSLWLTFLLSWPSPSSEAQSNGSSWLQTVTIETLSYKYLTFYPTLTRQGSPHLQSQDLGSRDRVTKTIHHYRRSLKPVWLQETLSQQMKQI